MSNPFEEIMERLQSLEDAIKAIKPSLPQPSIEIIDRATLCKRLGITEVTAIKYGKKGKIPEIKIGSSIRYDWPSVVKALQNQN